MMLILLLVQSVALFLLALRSGSSLQHSFLEGMFPADMAILAMWTSRGRRFCATAASVGLVSCSAILVHISGGNIEMHFHFFVMVAVITLYQDWVPFLFAIAFVTLHHGIVRAVDPARCTTIRTPGPTPGSGR